MATATVTSARTEQRRESASLRLSNHRARPAELASLPVQNPTTSYWQAEASSSALHDHGKTDALPAEHELHDVAIIGSGISGAVAAHMLLTREYNALQHDTQQASSSRGASRPSIIMLEARRACSGATGRNGGHCRPDSFAGFDRYSSIVGQEQADKVLRNEWDTFNLMEALCRDAAEPIDCDWWHGQTLGVYRSHDVKAAAKKTFESYKSYCGGHLREGVRFIDDEDEARKLSRVPDAVGAATWTAGSLHPLRFVHGILERCVANAAFKLFTHAPVETIEREGSGTWRIAGSRGVVRAKTVLVATNGYSTKLVPALADFLTPHRSQCSSIAPPSAYTGPMALATTASIIKGSGDYEYLTQRPSRGGPNTPHQADRQGDGIFILGGGHPVAPRDEQVGTFDDSVVNKAITEHLQAYPSKTFDGWQPDAGSMTHIWTGIQGYTRDSLPVVGEDYSQHGLFLCLGHHGHGMARAATCARGVARLILQGLEGGQVVDVTDEEWERVTALPSCYRWTEMRANRRDVDCRGDL